MDGRYPFDPSGRRPPQVCFWLANDCCVESAFGCQWNTTVRGKLSSDATMHREYVLLLFPAVYLTDDFLGLICFVLFAVPPSIRFCSSSSGPGIASSYTR